jgi:hypothetical protein
LKGISKYRFQKVHAKVHTPTGFSFLHKVNEDGTLNHTKTYINGIEQ